jgi:glucose dehydrogenase
LGLLAAPVVASCRSLPVLDGGPAEPNPDVVLAQAAATRERVLLATYDAALAAVPALTGRLGPLRADHAAHLAALGLPEVPTPAPRRGSGRGVEPGAEHSVAVQRRVQPVE